MMKAGFFGRPSGPFWIASSDASDTATDATCSATITPPTGTQVGDLLVLFIATGATNSGGAPTISVAPSWDALLDSASGGATGATSYAAYSRVYQSGDSGGWTIEATDAYSMVGCIQTARNATAIGNSRETTGTVNTASEIASTTAGSMLFVFAGGTAGNTDTPSFDTGPTETTFAEAKLASSSNYKARLWAGYEERIAGGATGTRTFTSTNVDYWDAFLVEIT